MTEELDHFLIHTRNRPVRAAFLIDTSRKAQALLQIEKVIEFASRKWGGKFFQIIPAPRGTVSNAWMEYLVQYDPDFIYSKVELSSNSTKKITQMLNASFLDIDTRNFISLRPDPIDVLPDAKNTAFLWRNPFQTYSILNFDLGHSANTPAYIRKFIKLNFGQLSGDYYTKQLTDGHVLQKSVTTKASLVAAMQELAKWNRHIYPIEYCYVPGVDRQSVREDYNGEVRTLFIGDNPDDLIHYWNHALLTPDWLSYRMINAWVPTKFLEDKHLLTALRGWINKFRGTGNSNDPHRINIRSSSVNLPILKKYARLLSENLYFSTDVQKITGPAKLSYQDHISIFGDMDSYSVSGRAFELSIKPVEQTQGGMGGQQWMTDFFIEQENPDRRIVNPSQYWLLFPRYNALAYHTLNKVGARINRLGQPTTFMSRDDRLTSITLPDDRTILSNLLLGKRHFNYHSRDPREKVSQLSFSNYRSSQAGRSLRGFIHLFGGLMEAAHFFENPYWRRVFMTMAGEDPLGDTRLNQDLRKSTEKNLKVLLQQGKTSTKAVDAWVNRIQSYAREIKVESQEKDFNFFENEFLEEIKTYNKINRKNTKYTDNNKRGIKEDLSYLIDIKLLRLGVQHKCIHCGLKSFYEVEAVGSHNECIGCGYSFTLEAEQSWIYKLNTIAGHNGAIYSQVPLILALGELCSESRYSFYFHPPVDVFIGKHEKHLTDFDLFAIVDGKLIIGEVKNDQGGFKDDDFDKLYEAALILKPHKVILSSLDSAPNFVNQKRIDNLRARLKNQDTKVEWLNLSSTVFMVYPQGIWAW